MVSSMVNQHYLSTDIINEYLMEGDYADTLYLGFNKAFDMVSHHHAQVKMKN